MTCVHLSCKSQTDMTLQDVRCVWSSAKDNLALWKPVAPAGYCALGLFATQTSASKPNAASLFCVRNSAVIRCLDKPIMQTELAQTTAVRGADAQNITAKMQLWVYDKHTLAMQPNEHAHVLQPSAIAAGASQSHTTGDGVVSNSAFSVVFKAASACIHVRNINRLPLFDVAIDNIHALCESEGTGTTKSSADFRLEMWSYSGTLQAWETVVAPFRARVRTSCLSGCNLIAEAMHSILPTLTAQNSLCCEGIVDNHAVRRLKWTTVKSYL